jgi:signal transduction histidine kinase
MRSRQSGMANRGFYGIERDMQTPMVSVRALFLAFVAVGLAFIISTAFSQYRAAAIDTMAVEIAGDLSTGIQHLSAVRAELQHIHDLAEDYVENSARGNRSGPSLINRNREQLRSDVQSYLDLPMMPGEKDVWETLSRGLPCVDESVDRVLAQVQAGDFSGAEDIVHGELSRTVDAMRGAAFSAVNFNAMKAKEFALRIEATRNRSMVIAFILDGLCFVLTVTTGALVARAIKSYGCLVESHNRLLEDRADELELFAGRVAHDILSPMQAVGLAIDGAAAAEHPGASREFLEEGRASLHRIHTMVSGLLEFARAGAKPAPGQRAEVREVIEGMESELIRAAAHAASELRFLPFAPCSVEASPGVLVSLLENLIRNAIKYMGDSRVRRITVRLKKRDEMVRFEVEDTGPGIPPSLGERIFEPYVRGHETNRPGIGLGLATVKRLAEAHGGSVGFRSQMGSGSLFWFALKNAERSGPCAGHRVLQEPEIPVPQP